MISAPGRRDNLIHHRRMMIASAMMADPEAGQAELFAGDGRWRRAGAGPPARLRR